MTWPLPFEKLLIFLLQPHQKIYSLHDPCLCALLVIRDKDGYATRFLTLSGSISLENGPGQIRRKMF